jgi:hypothetical protein
MINNATPEQAKALMNSSDFSSQPMEIQNAVKAKAGT